MLATSNQPFIGKLYNVTTLRRTHEVHGKPKEFNYTRNVIAHSPEEAIRVVQEQLRRQPIGIGAHEEIVAVGYVMDVHDMQRMIKNRIHADVEYLKKQEATENTLNSANTGSALGTKNPS